MNERLFWIKVNKGTDSGCWLWIASVRGSFGYGAYRNQYAHRVAWELTYGSIPDGMCVLHKCDVPACVNPDHLFLGTRTDNNTDMVTKGRARGAEGRSTAGERNGNSKLTEDQVRTIRELREQGWTLKTLAQEFGVSSMLICKIVNRKYWRHVE